jgi:hypothetical protein
MHTLSSKTIVARPDITAETYAILKAAVDGKTEDAVVDKLLAGYTDMITGTGGGLKCNVVRMLVEHYEVMNGLSTVSFAYVSEATERQGVSDVPVFYVTGWMGNVYGRCALGREFRCGFGGGSVRRSVSVTIKGRAYYGTNYGGVGMYCRLKPCKGGK